MVKIAFLLLLAGQLAFAGNRVGNGGNVVDCPKKTELLDFYEMEKPPVISGEDYQKVLAGRLELLKKVAPKLAGQYERRAKNIAAEIDFRSGVALTDVADSLHAFAPADAKCKVKQIAIRQSVPSGTKRFVFDKDLWAKLNPLNQAGLIMHEIVYEHFSKLGAQDSRKARRLNAFLFSPEMESVSAGKFWLVIKDLEIPVYP